MPRKRKIQEPKTGIMQKRTTFVSLNNMRVPADVHHAMKILAARHSIRYNRNVSIAEMIVRSCIDRIGAEFGSRYASRLYRQYCNGLGELPSDGAQKSEIEQAEPKGNLDEIK